MARAEAQVASTCWLLRLLSALVLVFLENWVGQRLYWMYYPLSMRNTANWLSKTLVFLVSCVPVLGIAPIATVSSPEPFSLDGRAVAVSGITMVPLKVGNEVATSTAPAVLFFADGSSVKLAAGSRAKLIGSEAQPKLVLLAGSLDYKVVLGSNLSVTSLDLERKAKPMARAGQPAPKTVTTPRPDEATLSVVTR